MSTDWAPWQEYDGTDSQRAAAYAAREPKVKSTKVTRPLKVIAAEVRANWTKVNYAAEPYLAAMETLTNVNDDYYADSGKSIVLYFLSNATTWRGPVAQRIKAELKDMVYVRTAKR